MCIAYKIEILNNAIDKDNIHLAGSLILEIENLLIENKNNSYYQALSFNYAGCLIDYGMRIQDKRLVEKGIERIQVYGKIFPEQTNTIIYNYNLASGFAALRKLSPPTGYFEGFISNLFINEVKLYRNAIALVEQGKIQNYEKQLLPNLYTNYGNTLDDLGRPIEALEFFDQSLAVDPNNANALANKALVISNLVFFAQEHKFRFVEEAKRLITIALDNSPSPQLKKFLEIQNEKIDVYLIKNPSKKEIEMDDVAKTETEFQIYLKEFCIKNNLFLTPTTILGEKNFNIYGDPLFISKVRVDLGSMERINRYIAFFNQIKQDFIFSRYLLVNSQFRTSYTDIIDNNVVYYYPVDYSVISSYSEMLKIAYRLAIDTLDKIAFFIREYCDVVSVNGNDVTFRNIFSRNKEPYKLRNELLCYNNKYLLGLLSLAMDLRKDGYFSSVIERRNALTHRFVSLHTELLSKSIDLVDYPKLLVGDFLDETINVMRLLKAAIIYLLLFIDVEESKRIRTTQNVPIYSQKVEGVLRWTPNKGDK